MCTHGAAPRIQWLLFLGNCGLFRSAYCWLIEDNDGTLALDEKKVMWITLEQKSQ